MSIQDEICKAIQKKQIISFWYAGSTPSTRTVEPHLLGFAQGGSELTLSAWQLSGGTRSGWRDFHVAGISNLSITDRVFQKPRSDYNPRDSTMSPIICRL